MIVDASVAPFGRAEVCAARGTAKAIAKVETIRFIEPPVVRGESYRGGNEILEMKNESSGT
jgi:hypothetical protein